MECTNFESDNFQIAARSLKTPQATSHEPAISFKIKFEIGFIDKIVLFFVLIFIILTDKLNPYKQIFPPSPRLFLLLVN